MGRTNQQKLCYSCSVRIGEIILLKDRYTTLNEIAKDLNLTYQQVADISANRKSKFVNQFKYQPKIEIEKIYPIDI
jgi:hypothetical protein|tara:strand:+ start:276 stop:503 length:228 start_codon:yes stop_codon:yes gene_type:complete